MTEEDGDFLDGVIDFGDGKQYNVAPVTVAQPAAAAAAEEEQPSGDRLGDDYDRRWPASTASQAQPQPGSSPSTSPLTSTNSHGERVLFNDRHNRMEPLPPRQTPTTPTLLHAQPTRNGPTRRESDGRGFREPPNWNAPSQRGTYATSEASDRQGDTRMRRPSASERDRVFPSGGLGQHLRDRSPDGSGRFPGRNIQRMSRRDSQASSGIVPSVPARSTRALSRESSDRGSGIRQLPPHLSAASAAAHGPPLVTGNLPSSISSRASWRGSPIDARSPSQAPQTPSIVHPETIQPNAKLETSASAVSPSEPSQQDPVASLLNDETALKAAMAVAAERARKRKMEEEEQRKMEAERARKKLADLEAKMQAEKEAKELAAKEAEEKIRQAKEEAERLLKQKESEDRAKEKEKERPAHAPRAPPSRPPMPSDLADSWRGQAPVRPTVSTNTPPGRKMTNGSARSPTDSKRSPTILKSKHYEQSQASSMPPKLGPVDLSGKPANSAVIAEVAALQSKTTDDSVQTLHFSDLRQLAEGFGQNLPVPTVVTNGTDPAPVKTGAHPRSPTEARSHENGPPQHSPIAANFDEANLKSGKHPKSKAPSALNFAPRGSQDHGPNGPVSAGISPSWSPRTHDFNQPGYRQAPISVLDDTLSRFKIAIMHSNPEHAGMSSDDIIQGLGRTGVEPERGSRQSGFSRSSGGSSAIISNEPMWAQTQVIELEEEEEVPNVLIPTFSRKRDPVQPKRLQGMKIPQPWRWDYLTFDPPVEAMNRRTLSVIESLTQGPTGGTVHLRVKIPGRPTRTVPYAEFVPHAPQASKGASRPRREDLRVNASSYPSPPTGGPSPAPKTAPSGGQWPNKAKGSDEAVWRRAVPVTASLEQPPVPPVPEMSPAPKSTPGPKHNRNFSSTISPLSTPPQTTSTWGRSPLSLTITEDLPEDPSLKAAWNKGSAGSEAQVIKNSLRELADEPPPQIPSSINDLKSEDGDVSKVGEKLPTPPTTKQKYDPHRAFQQVSSQPPAPQPTHEPSPVVHSSPLPSMYPTPRSNALALSTNRTPRQTPPSSLPPPAVPMNQPRQGYTMPYPTPMHPMGSPYTQPMMVSQYPPVTTPIMAPTTPGMVHRNVVPGMSMQPAQPNPPMWGQQSPATASPSMPMGFVRPMHTSLPPTGSYPASMVPPGPPSVPLYPHSTVGMMHHPPSPAMSPMMAPGMAKPFPNPTRQNSLPNGVPLAPNGLPVSVPVTFQVPPSNGHMSYMVPGHMHPPSHSPQGVLPPHARPPQGRGGPLHPSQYPPAPNNFQRW
ncbi:hypothetical protein M408DRAFT_138383 [Serendipita vermifera MAFF 305830]|uniref:Uncharacterized protein n=1 Tax=Serendipita vermifera MAFF 305830 TaxID=933852 RepID=A0A0C3AM82_SERVB|nr:hypothetical protein M408DRAFT_138383 [Serendipita vermifera MAFF 305830]